MWKVCTYRTAQIVELSKDQALAVRAMMGVSAIRGREGQD